MPPAGDPDNAIEEPVQPLTLFAVTVGNGFTVIDAEELVFVHPFASVNVCVYVVLAPEYGFATLHVPPAGDPDNAIEDPAQPLTLFAVTTGS